MQSVEILYYALFAISVAATCALPNNQMQELLENPTEKRLTKREAAIFVMDSIPAESVTSSKPKRVYKRISKPRNYAYRFGPKLHDSINNPQKRYKTKKNKSMFSAPSAKKRLPKTPPKYYVKGKLPVKKTPAGKKPAKRIPRPTIPEFPHQRPMRKPSVEQMSFGEPPSPSPAYYDVPVDSYGAPLKTTVLEPNLPDTEIENYDVQNADTGPDYVDWHVQTPMDNMHAFSNNYQSFANPSKFEKYQNEDDYYRNSYVPKYKDMASNNKHIHFKSVKLSMNRPWMRSKAKEDDKVLVGGQYAEPPGRYVPMSHPDEKIIFDDSELFSSGDKVHVIDIEPSATVSPYVNYKNSNMAFSPQNLNDAFSLDK